MRFGLLGSAWVGDDNQEGPSRLADITMSHSACPCGMGTCAEGGLGMLVLMPAIGQKRKLCYYSVDSLFSIWHACCCGNCTNRND